MFSFRFSVGGKWHSPRRREDAEDGRQKSESGNTGTQPQMDADERGLGKRAGCEGRGGWPEAIRWQMEQFNDEAKLFLPRMETDVCLEGPGRKIIVDTKFYASALKQSAFGEPRLLAANLYQLYTYLRQKSSDTGREQAEGVLLYPRTTRDIAVDFTTHGHRIRALTLNLAESSWRNIHHQLLRIVQLATNQPGQTAPVQRAKAEAQF
jgi:hypothetical protein